MALEKQMNYGFILGPQNVGEYKTMDVIAQSTLLQLSKDSEFVWEKSSSCIIMINFVKQ